ncbi:type II toxin-antitoxin system RelE/ParE family toxin [Rhodoplanes roseus]|uniref:Plasmid stabilization protein n=1 Tax=Rhodoplanes roseus TaxID=29409 RepID=A0A327L1D3_9BRAD|nr:type II toxin-antitoxin system RelE/ParE family toxin [Rhodoplanes roseus]RAI41508.1 plasmid stabilization protein [Rhodoplanes roseus]
MKVVVTEAAFSDLIEIGRAVARDDPTRAETLVSELYDRCRQLGATPRAFPLLPDWEERGVRRRVCGSYLIFYRLDADRVQVLHVLHGARDYASVLFPDE